jgi:hypothetical protein
MLFDVLHFGVADVLPLPHDDTWHEYQSQCHSIESVGRIF